MLEKGLNRKHAQKKKRSVRNMFLTRALTTNLVTGQNIRKGSIRDLTVDGLIMVQTVECRVILY